MGVFEVTKPASENGIEILDDTIQTTAASTTGQRPDLIPKRLSAFRTAGPICGALFNLGCRGADSASEFSRQRDKTISAISAINADIVGLVEIENNVFNAIDDLVSGVNAIVGAGTYDYIDTSTIGTDAIKVGFMYKVATIKPVGDYAILDSMVDPLFIDTSNRPSLAQTFEEISNKGKKSRKSKKSKKSKKGKAGKFTVVVNHLKSKGSNCNSLGDPDLNDGQGNCNLTRTNAAIALVNWLGTDPTGSADSDFLIIGDLNAYAMEDPITAIRSAGYTNLIDTFSGSDAYSFVFGGESGYLDYALANGSLAAQVSGVTEWHINADEPRTLDYNEEFKSPAQLGSLYSPDAYRASDHDPVLVGLELIPSCREKSAKSHKSHKSKKSKKSRKPKKSNKHACQPPA